MLQADLNTALSSPFTASYSDASYSSDEEDGENPREKDQVKLVISFRICSNYQKVIKLWRGLQGHYFIHITSRRTSFGLDTQSRDLGAP